MDSIKHPAWEKDKVTIHHDNFDEKTFQERRQYFLNVNEDVSFSLPRDDWYDRIRFCREELAKKHILSKGSNYNPAVNNNIPTPKNEASGVKKAVSHLKLIRGGYKEVD